MKKFLVAIDGSEGSNAAIDEALDLAQEVGAQVTFAFVRKPPSSLLGSPYYERLLSTELANRACGRPTLRRARRCEVGVDAQERDPRGRCGRRDPELRRQQAVRT